MNDIWVKVFKNGPNKTFGRQPLKNLKLYDVPKQTISLQTFSRLFSTDFTQYILEYFDPYQAKDLSADYMARLKLF